MIENREFRDFRACRQPEVWVNDGVLRIIAADDHSYRQSVVLRFGLSRMQIVVEIAGGSSPDRSTYYLRRFNVNQVELIDDHSQLHLVNSTMLPVYTIRRVAKSTFRVLRG